MVSATGSLSTTGLEPGLRVLRRHWVWFSVLFAVDPVTRYIEWKLGHGVGARPNGTGAIPVTRNSSPLHLE